MLTIYDLWEHCTNVERTDHFKHAFFCHFQLHITIWTMMLMVSHSVAYNIKWNYYTILISENKISLMKLGIDEPIHHIERVAIRMEGNCRARHQLGFEEPKVINANDNCWFRLSMLILNCYCCIAGMKK